jgi:hypothetical protein
MSHVAIVEIEVDDLGALKAACEKLGIEFRENQKTWKWFGRWVNDYHAAEASYHHGLKPEDYGKSDHAIHVPGANYEVGVIKRGNKYQLHYDNYGRGGGMEPKLGGRGLPAIKQEYGAQRTRRMMMRKGYQVTRKVLTDGSIQMACRHA